MIAAAPSKDSGTDNKDEVMKYMRKKILVLQVVSLLLIGTGLLSMVVKPNKVTRMLFGIKPLPNSKKR